MYIYIYIERERERKIYRHGVACTNRMVHNTVWTLRGVIFNNAIRCSTTSSFFVFLGRGGVGGVRLSNNVDLPRWGGRH